jgi:hypothetical protein
VGASHPGRVSNLAGTDLWGSEVTLTSSRGAVAATAIAEYALAAAAHFARCLHEAARQKAVGQFTREGYQMRTLHGATMGVVDREVARLSRAAGMRVIGTSVDEDNQLIYIEVKSTKSADPTEAFYISHAELIEAAHRRSRFFIYRVTKVDSLRPHGACLRDSECDLSGGKLPCLCHSARTIVSSSSRVVREMSI